MKKINPWKLAVVFLGLVVVFLALKKFRSPRLEGNLPSSLTQVDTAAVTEVIITPAKSPNQAVRLVKSGGWKLMDGDKNLRLEQGAGSNAVRMLMSMRPERMVSKRKDKWDEYLVGDSTGTRVQVKIDDDVEADLVIGRSEFGQTATGSYGAPFTYVRKFDEPEVYTVSGFFDAQYNRVLNDWRDKSFTRIKKDSVTRVSFHYPADSSFVVERRNNKWMIGNDLADSARWNTFLSGLEYRNANLFAPIAPAGVAPVSIQLERNGKPLGTLEAWPGEGNWAARSSHQPETFFSLDDATRRDVFVGRSRFVQSKK